MPIKRAYSEHGDACATSHALELTGDRWTYPVLRELFLAPKRFAELQAALHGITPAVLTARLRQLESTGLVRRIEMPAATRGPAYAATEWAAQLRPMFAALGRWALRSPVRETEGCGLTPDAIMHSMLTMAPHVAMDPPVELELCLADARIGPSAPRYAFRLHWADGLSIDRAPATTPAATVIGDSSTWMRVLYEGANVDAMQITGDRAALQRVVAAFAHALEDATAPSSPQTAPT